MHTLFFYSTLNIDGQLQEIVTKILFPVVLTPCRSNLSQKYNLTTVNLQCITNCMTYIRCTFILHQVTKSTYMIMNSLSCTS